MTGSCVHVCVYVLVCVTEFVGYFVWKKGGWDWLLLQPLVRMRSEGYGSVSVCLSVCRSVYLSVKSVSLLPYISLLEPLITPQTIPRIQRRIEVEKCGVFSETAAFRSYGVKHERKRKYAA